MRARLIGILLVPLVIILTAISVPLAVRLASGAQEAMFLNRLEDTDQLASIAEQVVGRADTNLLQDELVRYHEIFGVNAAIIGNGLIVLESAGHLDLTEPGVATALRLALSGHDSTDPATFWFDSTARLAVAVPIVQGDGVIGAALTVSPTGRLRASLAGHLRALVAADVGAVALFTLAAWGLTSWVLRPVRALNSAIVQNTRGDLGVHAPTRSGPSEIRQLAGSFNSMVGEVRRVFDSQRAFIANASHQLRNPLTALMLRLRVVGMEVPAEQQPELNEILLEADRLDTVIDHLLELALVQSGTAAEPEPVDIVPLAHDRATAWRPQAHGHDVRIDVSGPATAVAYVNPALTGSILDAILDNAIKYSPSGARVTILVTDRRGCVHVEIRDEGPGIPPDELSHVGERFWRSRPTSHIPGSGLGLSIAFELAAAMGARLEFAAAEPHGLVVGVQLLKPTPWRGAAP